MYDVRFIESVDVISLSLGTEKRGYLPATCRKGQPKQLQCHSRTLTEMRRHTDAHTHIGNYCRGALNCDIVIDTNLSLFKIHIKITTVLLNITLVYLPASLIKKNTELSMAIDDVENEVKKSIRMDAFLRMLHFLNVWGYS